MKLLEVILKQAKKEPERIALSERGRAYTYRDLFAAMGQIKNQIDAEKSSDRPILVYGENDFLTLASMLAVSATGRAYIPVDAHTPKERTELILQASKPSLVIISTRDQEINNGEGTIEFGSHFQAHFDEAQPFAWESVDLSQAVTGQETHYIIYTSGTTGVPKGVAVSHDNLLSFTQWMNQDFEHIEANQFLEQALYSFDLSIFSIYPSLTTGGTLVTLSKDETNNFKHLFERLNSTEINTWISTPSFVDICLLDPSFTQAKHPALTQFIFCGEELTVKTAQKLLAQFPNAAVYNTYGPTEATGAVTQIRVTSELLEKVSRVPLGYAKPGVHVEIIDQELIIIGDSVAKGYFENPEKTQAAFFEYHNEPAYHSGDAGSVDEDGLLHYQGRLDFQVKFNGFRIELQDIEAHLLGIDTVEKAIVLPKLNENHKVTALIAVLQSTERFPDKKAERAYTKGLKKELLKTVMDYMIPTQFVYQSDFPLTNNGKIDRKRLTTEILGG